MFTPDASALSMDAELAQRVHNLKAMAGDLGASLAVHADAAGRTAACRSEDARVCNLAANTMSEYAIVVMQAAEAISRRALVSASVAITVSEVIKKAEAVHASYALVRALEAELDAAIETVVRTRIETTPAIIAMKDMAVRANVGHEQVKASMGERSAETDTWGMAVVGAVWALVDDQRSCSHLSVDH